MLLLKLVSLFFLHLVSLSWVKLAESVRSKTLSIDAYCASSVANPIRADGGDDGGGEGEAWPVQEVPEEECPPHLCLHLVVKYCSFISQNNCVVIISPTLRLTNI